MVNGSGESWALAELFTAGSATWEVANAVTEPYPESQGSDGLPTRVKCSLLVHAHNNIRRSFVGRAEPRLTFLCRSHYQRGARGEQ